ncbi:MAG: YqeG family HAD IIIA-type phosphatase [Pirellulales bacterium]|nr:YqeG family HAD IIIA-type phosphatase [Pirellulales bacterium]
MKRCFTADLQVRSVQELRPERLESLRLEALLLDVDCTLKPYRDEEVGPEVAAWLDELCAAGVRLCLVSNGRGPRIERFAGRLGLPFVAKACKPFPFGCREGVKKLGSDPTRTAMVGDQLFADIMAGRLAGLFTILVTPLHPEQEPWYTRLKRPLERCFVRWEC